ncbi:transposase InsK for insertion sequence [Streptococcus pneumoniae]|nr:transposase InsK for insertion sequence [Streptococcus pneumoniae]
MNYTPKVRQKKSNFWGVFIMKLTYDDKVQIYELRKQGYSLEKLSNKFGINNSNIRYMIKLIDRYGIEFVKKGKILLLRKQEGEYLRAENAILKKLRELRLKEEKEKEERQKLFKN